STEMLGVLATGEIWLKVPQSIRLCFDGALPDGVMAKDVALRAIGSLGHNGATYKAMEFCGSTISAMPMDERLCIANMSVEAGAKNGIMACDAITQAYLEKNGSPQGICFDSDDDAEYEQSLNFDTSKLEPLIACPNEVDNVTEITNVQGIRIHQAYIGSCTGGRYNDLKVAADMLRGLKIAKGIRLLVSPASRKIWEECARDGILTTLSEAGATILASSCGACLGIHSGAIGAGEVCVSATNRNFIGRMGSKEGQVYLASPLSVAASAVTGYLTDPRKL
ncbi:MAG: aconitase family protein, partial [Eubacterium sp.]